MWSALSLVVLLAGIAAVLLGDVIYESGQPLEFVYFPTNCIISLLYVLLDGACDEISVVGYEGMVGVAVFMGGESTPAERLCEAKAAHIRCLRWSCRRSSMRMSIYER